MIQQLRKKFILVAMGSMFAVLAVILGTLNVVTYSNTVQNVDRILAVLAENDGRFPADFPGRWGLDAIGKPDPRRGQQESYSGEDLQTKPPRADEAHIAQPEESGDSGDFWISGRFRKSEKFWQAGEFRGMSEETPYETRFFSVRLNESGEVVSVDTGRIAAVETADAIVYSQELFASGRERGFYGDYRFLNEAVKGSRDRCIIFVDCSRDMRGFYSVMRNSVGMALLGLAAVLALVLYFSQKVFRPVAESYEKQRRFVTDASHELKTPLTIISANVDILEMEGEESQWTASIRHQVKRLKSLTEQMVTLSRMDEQQGIERKEFSLSRAVEETVEGFEALAVEQGRELKAEIEEGILYRGDESGLRQMTGLLLDNALKYSAEKGTVRLKLESCRRRGYKVKLTMWNPVSRDAGLASGSQDKLFERFYRPDASRSSQTGGSGIGLSIVKSIVELHNGNVTAESEDGGSILFTVLL